MTESTAREHLDWCVERAMVYANMGDMSQAWASFGSDAMKHDGTRWIVEDPLYGMTMMFQYGRGDGAEEFRKFVSAYAVGRSAVMAEVVRGRTARLPSGASAGDNADA